MGGGLIQEHCVKYTKRPSQGVLRIYSTGNLISPERIQHSPRPWSHHSPAGGDTITAADNTLFALEDTNRGFGEWPKVPSVVSGSKKAFGDQEHL